MDSALDTAVVCERTESSLGLRQKRFVRVFASEMFPTSRVNIQIAQKFSNLSFFFLRYRDFVKLFDV